MNKLIINTANASLDIVLVKDNRIFFKSETSVKKHNERILKLIDELLQENDLQINDINQFGVVVGPGSFTGIRVGIATIKAFRDVIKVEAKGINNLEILYDIAQKDNVNFVAIEGSLNSFFVGEKINGKLYINKRNLSVEELKVLAKNDIIACYEISENMKNCGLNFKKYTMDFEVVNNVFERSSNYDLLPVYYQLSQAENDKINHSNLHIEELNKNDISNILAIENECFVNINTGEKPWNEKMICELFNENKQNFVAKINDEIVGYIFTEISDEINVSRVAVKNDFQNHGIASKLFEKIFDLAKSKNMNVSLEVCENNITAQKLYSKLGFVIRRERKNYYSNGETCYEMVKMLN